MSGPPGGGNGPPAPRSSSNGPQNVGLPMPPQHQANGAQLAGAGSGSGPNGNMSQQDLNSIVSDEFLGLIYCHCCCLYQDFHLNLLHIFHYGTVRSAFTYLVVRLCDLASVSCS